MPSVGWMFQLVLVVPYCQLLQLVRLLHGFLRRDGIMERNELCAGVCHWCCCCLLVASWLMSHCCSFLSRSMCGASFCSCPCGSGKVCVPCFFPCTCPCRPARSLPQGDGIVPGRERAQDVTAPFLLDALCCLWCCMGRRACL